MIVSPDAADPTAQAVVSKVILIDEGDVKERYPVPPCLDAIVFLRFDT